MTYKHIMAIDMGMNVVAACFSPVLSTPILFRSLPLQQIQKQLCQLSRSNRHHHQAMLLEEREKLIGPIFHQLSFEIVQWSRRSQIQRIVVGDGNMMSHWGQFPHQQLLRSIPFHLFYQQLQHDSSSYHITTYLEDEQYTSKVDALSQEEICYHRHYRGCRKGSVYRRPDGSHIHADVNAAMNIYRKHVEMKQTHIQIQHSFQRVNVYSPLWIEI